MYYKKYFSGSVDATTTTNQYYMGLNKVATGTALRVDHVKNRSDVVGNAIVATLKNIGYPNAYWDSTSGYVFMDKTKGLCGFYLSCTSYGYMYVSGGYRGSNRVEYSSSSAMQVQFSGEPFSASRTLAASYAFYITIIGEPKGVCKICIGNYTTPTDETQFFHICLGTDKRNNSDLFGFNFSNSDNINTFFMVNYTTVDLLTGTSGAGFGTKLRLQNEVVVLLPMFLTLGYIFIKNTYLQCGIATNGFYEIDGDTYHVMTYYMTKCITTI